MRSNAVKQFLDFIEDKLRGIFQEMGCSIRSGLRYRIERLSNYSTAGKEVRMYKLVSCDYYNTSSSTKAHVLKISVFFDDAENVEYLFINVRSLDKEFSHADISMLGRKLWGSDFPVHVTSRSESKINPYYHTHNIAFEVRKNYGDLTMLKNLEDEQKFCLSIIS